MVANTRDLPDLKQFANRTEHCERVERDAIGGLEPELAGRFSHGLYFESECHLDPRRALTALVESLQAMPDVELRFGRALPAQALNSEPEGDWRIGLPGPGGP